MFSIAVVSPEKLLYEGEAEEVVVPAYEGTMSILPRHAPLLAALKKGTVKIISHSIQKEFDIIGGFVEVSDKKKYFVNIFAKQS